MTPDRYEITFPRAEGMLKQERLTECPPSSWYEERGLTKNLRKLISLQETLEYPGNFEALLAMLNCFSNVREWQANFLATMKFILEHPTGVWNTPFVLDSHRWRIRMERRKCPKGHGFLEVFNDDKAVCHKCNETYNRYHPWGF